MFHTTAAQSNCIMGSMQAAGWCWQTLESIQGCNKLPHHWNSAAGFKTYRLLYLVMENALQTLPCSTRNTPVPPVCRWQHLFVSCRAFPREMLWEDDTTLPRPISTPRFTAFVPLWCQTLREGGDFCDRVWETGRFCACRPPSPFPMKICPFFVCPLYTMAATPLVLKKGHVLDIWTKWQTRKRQLKSEG